MAKIKVKSNIASVYTLLALFVMYGVVEWLAVGMAVPTKNTVNKVFYWTDPSYLSVKTYLFWWILISLSLSFCFSDLSFYVSLIHDLAMFDCYNNNVFLFVKKCHNPSVFLFIYVLV